MTYITMHETRQASPNGFDVALYEAGKTYNVPNGLATSLIKSDWARNATFDEVIASINNTLPTTRSVDDTLALAAFNWELKSVAFTTGEIEKKVN